MKRTKREIIIIVVAVVVIIYSGIDFLTSQKIHFDTKNQMTELENFILEISGALGKGSIGSEKSYTIGKAEIEWMTDPFYTVKFVPVAESKETVKKIDKPVVEKKGFESYNFAFTGYMEARGTKIAIINGVKYVINDALKVEGQKKEGYIVKSISPNMVIIDNKEEKKIHELMYSE
jgi:hypothetical protein